MRTRLVGTLAESILSLDVEVVRQAWAGLVIGCGCGRTGDALNRARCGR
ncbi:MAG TPA: hypothetical protein VHN80_12655 [Kineosporiaceae bacterium]|nr:hypothetical protein [Kineosporiaceae bacterium]